MLTRHYFKCQKMNNHTTFLFFFCSPVEFPAKDLLLKRNGILCWFLIKIATQYTLYSPLEITCKLIVMAPYQCEKGESFHFYMIKISYSTRSWSIINFTRIDSFPLLCVFYKVCSGIKPWCFFFVVVNFFIFTKKMSFVYIMLTLHKNGTLT